MPKIFIQGRLSHKIRSILSLIQISLQVVARRAIGKPLVNEWTLIFEMGTLFWQKQFHHAFSLNNVVESREYIDSLYTVLDAKLDIDILPSAPNEPKGEWFIPRQKQLDTATMLYFHGGGYAFYAAVTRHFIGMLAQTLGISIFAPDYRLAPEHPHPAQLDDGLKAYQFILDKGINPKHLIVSGDSAGGHLALMTLANLSKAQLPQPALVIAISPWVDIDARGASLSNNNDYDLLLSYQTQQFAKWFKGESNFPKTALSPMYQNYRGLAPIYIQAGSKEILVDMICDFANTLKDQDAMVRLDVWEHMVHEFQAYGKHLPQSHQALERIRACIDWAIEKSSSFETCNQTKVNNFMH